MDRSESSEARVVPLPEKLDRTRLQKERLVGISFTPSVEPSQSLIDRACQQLEDNVLSYIELNRCSSRHDETLNAKTDTTLSLDPSGSLRLSKRQKLDNISITGEHRLRQAFLRRALAYDLANIGTFSVLDKWTQKMFERMNATPLANYKFVSVEQIMNADVLYGSSSQIRREADCIQQLAQGRHLTLSLKHCVIIQRCCNTSFHCSRHRQSRVRTFMTIQCQTETHMHLNLEKEKARAKQKALVRSTWTTSSFARSGRLEGAPRKSKRESVV